ncbi:unnamed protein product [Pleuronectes platessa]|uniref:Uncharacterized protein n=1 Tax=Pleuronectes platessa TaxID=8262 RepID=A0A9N7V810_PLEPL|nr:unnamed protein product [Pleuronectes platessa]
MVIVTVNPNPGIRWTPVRVCTPPVAQCQLASAPAPLQPLQEDMRCILKYNTGQRGRSPLLMAESQMRVIHHQWLALSWVKAPASARSAPLAAQSNMCFRERPPTLEKSKRGSQAVCLLQSVIGLTSRSFRSGSVRLKI